jgi:hypothetical protein
MTERMDSGPTFKEIKANAKNRGNLSPERWETGMAVVCELMNMGEPLSVLHDSSVGPDIPRSYKVGEVEVEFMPQWRYATVLDGDKRTYVLFSETTDPRLPEASRDLADSEIIANIKTAIHGETQKVS